MNRRSFTQSTALAATSLPFLGAGTLAAKKIIKPKRLRKGDTIGLITPGSFIDDESLEKAVQNVEKLGFKVKLAKNIRAERGYNAGTDQERLDDLHHMFADTQVQGIWCARGGYGCTRLLPMIDYKLIRKNPKVLIGYSDITALHQAIQIETALVGFHGPVASSDFTDYTLEYFTKVLIEPQATLTIPLAEANLSLAAEDSTYSPFVIKAGKARGRLAGGNLTLLAALVGTPWALNARRKLVFMEDIGERPYRIDRMLTQLRQTARLDEAAALALGIFDGCEAKEGSRSLSLEACLQDRLADLTPAAMYGLSFGHIANQCTLPIGIEADLDTETQTLRLLEQAVI